jgi:putative multiple sugar transport system permease protein
LPACWCSRDLLNVLSGRSVGPFPDLFQKLSAGFIPDIIGPITLVAPTLNASGAPTPNTGVVLHSTTMLIGLLIVAAMLYFALKSRKSRESHGYDAEPFGFFIAKNVVLAAIVLFLMYKFASFKGLSERSGRDGHPDCGVRVHDETDDVRAAHLRHGRQ